MSEKIEEYTEECIKRKHVFYCDICGKFILSSVEWEDGYYHKPTEIKVSVEFPCGCGNNLNYDLTDTCTECAAKKLAEINMRLKEIGFKEE